jgi:hypothetical protein
MSGPPTANSAGRSAAAPLGIDASTSARPSSSLLGPAQVDEAGHGRAHGLGVGLGRIADADAVDGAIVVVGVGERIAVGGESRAQVLRERQPFGSRSEQDFGRAQRARAQHDDICREPHAGLPAVFGARGDVDAPPAVLLFRQRAHLDAREDFGAVACRGRQIGQRRGGLGADVAAGAAVAAQHAGVLLHAGGVDAVLEGDVQRRQG